MDNYNDINNLLANLEVKEDEESSSPPLQSTTKPNPDFTKPNPDFTKDKKDFEKDKQKMNRALGFRDIDFSKQNQISEFGNNYLQTNESTKKKYKDINVQLNERNNLFTKTRSHIPIFENLPQLTRQNYTEK